MKINIAHVRFYGNISLLNRCETYMITDIEKDYMVFRKGTSAFEEVIFEAGKSYKEYLN